MTGGRSSRERRDRCVVASALEPMQLLQVAGAVCVPPGPPPPSSGVPPDKWVLAGAGVGVRIVPPPRETRLRPRPGVRCGLSTVRPCVGRGGIGCGVEAAGVLGEQAGAGDIPVTDDH